MQPDTWLSATQSLSLVMLTEAPTAVGRCLVQIGGEQTKRRSALSAIEPSKLF